LIPALCAPSEQALSVYTAYVTVPPALLVAPLNVDESWTMSPIFPVDSDSVVAIVREFLEKLLVNVHVTVSPPERLPIVAVPPEELGVVL